MIFPFVTAAAECEAAALQQALQIALNLGFNRVVFKIDGQIVVTAILNNSSYMNELGNLLSNCWTLLSSNVGYALAYIKRQANRVAHDLARASILHASLNTFSHPPFCIHFIILDEIQ